MATNSHVFAKLETRRRELGMTFAMVAERSGVSMPAVVRILTGRQGNARWGNVAAIAGVLGMGVEFEPVAEAEELREQQALRKAEKLMGMVQGTSGLEGQAVDRKGYEKMVRRTVHELMAGSSRRLWAD